MRRHRTRLADRAGEETVNQAVGVCAQMTGAVDSTSKAMWPATLAIKMMLPPVPSLSIWRPAACAVNSTPLRLISMTCHRRSWVYLFRIDQQKGRTRWNCSSGYSNDGVLPANIPAEATQTSRRPSRSPIVSASFHMPSYVPTLG